MIFNPLDLNLFAILSCIVSSIVSPYVVVINELMYVAIDDYISDIAIIMNHNPYVYYTIFNKYNAIPDSDVPLRFKNSPSVRLSVCEIIAFRGNLISNRPIDPKTCLNVGYGVVHV